MEHRFGLVFDDEGCRSRTAMTSAAIPLFLDQKYRVHSTVI